jgi:hypothetical protein
MRSDSARCLDLRHVSNDNGWQVVLLGLSRWAVRVVSWSWALRKLPAKKEHSICPEVRQGSLVSLRGSVSGLSPLLRHE